MNTAWIAQTEIDCQTKSCTHVIWRTVHVDVTTILWYVHKWNIDDSVGIDSNEVLIVLPRPNQNHNNNITQVEERGKVRVCRYCTELKRKYLHTRAIHCQWQSYKWLIYNTHTLQHKTDQALQQCVVRCKKQTVSHVYR